ncbi:MAM and LDL-receptor class A domain-containing protein 1-like isoform X2 [Lytechinus pictus]|uniref:MAM and LDL-receptor class A domain-containing protein 1-like isoform X2 n=1 Tax=Lytechinus pictus TaxID=7653 RepID=UPI0030B9F4A1
MTPFMNPILICVLTVIHSVCLTKNHDIFFSCDFGTRTDGTFCGMKQSADDDFDWKLTSTSGKSNTGPMDDHTGNLGGEGRFLWSDSNDGSIGQKATIATPPFNLTGAQALLTFWYHLYGNGRLKIAVCQGGKVVFILDGDQGNQWHEQNMTVSCGDLPLQIAFTATRVSDEADVGIDDINIFDIPMATSPESVTTSSSLISSTSSASSPHAATSLSNIPTSHIATSTETTFQSPSSSPSTCSESYREVSQLCPQSQMLPVSTPLSPLPALMPFTVPVLRSLLKNEVSQLCPQSQMLPASTPLSPLPGLMPFTVPVLRSLLENEVTWFSQHCPQPQMLTSSTPLSPLPALMPFAVPLLMSLL